MRNRAEIGLDHLPITSELRGINLASQFKQIGITTSRWLMHLHTPLLATLLIIWSGCGLGASTGDCGPYLSSTECHVVRTQLGQLDPQPPADPTNRFGRCVSKSSAECELEKAAAELGRRLFFDQCLSAGANVGCVTCHEPSAAFIDPRTRPIQTAPLTVLVDGAMTKLSLPLIENPTYERMKTPPPTVKPQLDATGTPLAYWDQSAGRWQPVIRRPQSSWNSILMGQAQGATARHSPTLFNIGYGSAAPRVHGAPTYGVTWTPWDGRYDSAWALVADVFEFGGTQNTDRAHIAIRIGQKHREAYEKMVGGPLPDFDAQVLDSGTMKFVYLRHGTPAASPTGTPPAPSSCWHTDAACPANVMKPTPAVRETINTVFVNSGKALGAYMRQLRSARSPFDRWLTGEENTMTAAAQRGLRLFVGKAECILCHTGPNFTDWQFHNLGVPSLDPEQRTAGSSTPTTPDGRTACFDGLAPAPQCEDPGRGGWQMRAFGQCAVSTAKVDGKDVNCQRVDWPAASNRYDIATDCRSAASDASNKDIDCLPATVVSQTKCSYADSATCSADPLCQWLDPPTARCVAKVVPVEQGQFKTPTLRNVALTFPYMHNGSLADYGPSERGETTADDPTPHLTRVVEFYNQGGGTITQGALDKQIHQLHLNKSEVADLVEFLKSLTDMSMVQAQHPMTVPPAGLDMADCPQ